MKWHTALIDKMKKLKHINSLQALREERGAIFVLTALMLPVLFGFLGFAYDVGNLYMHKARLQNATDAAALAGGDLFRNPPDKTVDDMDQSQGEYFSEELGKVVKKVLVNNVEVEEVQKKTQNVDYKDGTTIKSAKNGGVAVRTNSPNHVEADAIAKDYIEKNEINLGNTITPEEYSALAYKGTETTKVNGAPTTSGKITTTINTETTKVTDATFYRVIASEEVPLYFLPVILGEDKRIQTVRTTSIAKVENTAETVKTTTITQTQDGSVPTGGKTILNNLFTFTDRLELPNKVGSDDDDGSTKAVDNIKSTFDGDIVYSSTSPSFELREKESGILRYMLPDEDTKENSNKQKVVYELYDHTHYIEQNTSIDITDEEYLNAFKSPFFQTGSIVLKEDVIQLASKNETNSNGQNEQVFKISDMNKIMKEKQNNKEEGNIFYDKHSQDGGVKLIIDEPLGASLDGNYTKPVYFMFYGDSGRNACKIEVKCDMVRPIVVVWLSENNESLTFENSHNCTFNGVLYVPYKKIQFNNNDYFKFNGNAIAKQIEVKGESQTFKVNNYLNKEPGFANLTQITSTATKITQDQYNETFESVLNKIIAGSLDANGISEEKYRWLKTNLTAGGNLSNMSVQEKSDILKAWINVYKKTLDTLKAANYPGFQLASLNKINKFQWDDNYDPSEEGTTEPSSDEDVKIDNKPVQKEFRLINPRTETNPYFAKDTDI